MTIDINDRIDQLNLYAEEFPSVRITSIDKEIVFETIISQLKKDVCRYSPLSYDYYIDLKNKMWLQYDPRSTHIYIRSEMKLVYDVLQLNEKKGERLLRRLINRHLNISRIGHIAYTSIFAYV